MEDGEIVALLLAHDERGLREAADKYGSLLHSLAQNILHDPGDAEECVNDAYAKLWESVPPYRPVFLRSFLCKITRQIALDRYRYEHRQKRSPDEPLLSLDEAVLSSREPAEPAESENGSVYEGLSAAIDEFLDRLPPDARILFVRRYFLGESVTSLAKRFELDEKHLAVRFFRLRDQLKKFLRKKGYPL